MPQLEAITQLVLEWRKKELKQVVTILVHFFCLTLSIFARGIVYLCVCCCLSWGTEVCVNGCLCMFSSWKKFLQASEQEAVLGSYKWWFHLYSLCRDYESCTAESKSRCIVRRKKEWSEKLMALCCWCSFLLICSGVGEFVSSLQQFMETSSLAEFDSRLKLLSLFGQDMLRKGKFIGHREPQESLPFLSKVWVNVVKFGERTQK